MRLDPSLTALGFDDAAVLEAWRSGHVVGRGEGFLSREWRADASAASVVVCVHATPEELPVAAQAFVAGLGWEHATLGPVRESPTDPHDVTIRLLFGPDHALDAHVPDAAARRKLLPVGHDAQVSLVLLPTPPNDGVETSFELEGAVTERRPLAVRDTPWCAIRLVFGSGALWGLVRGDGPSGGEVVRVRGIPWVRVGASARGRGGTSRG